MKLEELARQSSVAARTSVVRLEPPPIGRESAGRRLVPAVALAGVLAVVAGGLYVLARPGDLESIPAAEVPGEVVLPHLALPADAAPWQVLFAGDLDGPADPASSGPTYAYYGTPGVDDPFADGDLMVGTVAGDGETIDATGETITVRSTEGATVDDIGLPDGATGITWIEDDGAGNRLLVVMASRSRSTDALVAIADDMTIDAAGGSVAIGPDVGLQLVEADANAPFVGVARGEQAGSVVTYDGGAEATVLITATAGELDATATAVRWWFGAVERVTVAGHDGIRAQLSEIEPSSQQNTFVMWSPDPGVVASLTYYGVDGDVDVLELAGSVVEVDDDTWAALVEVAGAGDSPAAGMDEVYAESSGEIGGVEYTWAIGLQDASLCLDVDTANGSNGSCGAGQGLDLAPGTAQTIDNMFGERIASVLIAADPEVTAIVDPTGVWTVTDVPIDDVTYWVAIGPSEVQPSFDVVVDDDVVDTLEAASAMVEEEATDTLVGEAAGEMDGHAYRWTLTERAGGLCLDLSIEAGNASSGSGTCEPLDSEMLEPTMPPRPVRSSLQDVRVALVVTGADVDEIRDPAGEAVATKIEAGERTYFVVVTPADGGSGLEAVSGGDVTPVEADGTAAP